MVGDDHLKALNLNELRVSSNVYVVQLIDQKRISPAATRRFLCEERMKDNKAHKANDASS